MDNFKANLADLQPSQLYISAEKLREVERSLGSDELGTIDPLPLKGLGGRTVLTDGHTRAFAAYRQGWECVLVYWDTDELDWEAYEICVRWCLEEGIHSVAGGGHQAFRPPFPLRKHHLFLPRIVQPGLP